MDARPLLEDLLSRARDHYADQFKAFADEQRAKYPISASEIKLQSNKECAIFNSLYCVDSIAKIDGVDRILELSPEYYLRFDAIVDQYREAALIIRHLRWDDVLLHHDLDTLPEIELNAWFHYWFDPEDERQPADPADLSCVIHSLLIKPRALSADFGTAPPEALWEMLELLEGAGATTITISSSIAEAEAE